MNDNSNTERQEAPSESLIGVPMYTKHPLYWAIAIAVAPALGYFYAFTYEKGYMSYFNAHEHLITLNVVTIITGTMYLSKALTWAFVVFSIIYTFLLFVIPKVFKLFYQIFFIFTLIYILGVCIYIYSRGFSESVYPFLLFIVLHSIVFYILPLTAKEFGATPLERSANFHNHYSLTPDLFTANSKNNWLFVFLKYVVILNLIVFTPQLLGNCFGYREARTEEYFLVLKDPLITEEERMVLRIYGYNAVLAPFDRSTKVVYPEFIVVNIQDINLKLKLEKIGPLVPAENYPS